MEALAPALYLIPVTLGDSGTDRMLPPYNRSVIVQLRHFIVEDIRSARRFLKLVDRDIDIDALTFYELNEHSDPAAAGHCIAPLLKGEAMGLLSEAGCPAVADPGATAVAQAHAKGLPVVPLVGPSSIIMAVMGSGFNGQSFAFNGYLPVKDGERAAKLRQLERRAWSEDQTQLFIEAPYRNLKMLEAVLSVCRKDTQLCIAAAITCSEETIQTHTVAEWQKLPAPDIHKVPAIFLLYRG